MRVLQEDEWSYSSESRSKANTRRLFLKILIVTLFILTIIMMSILATGIKQNTGDMQISSSSSNNNSFDFEPVSFLDDPPTETVTTEAPTSKVLTTKMPTTKSPTELPTTSSPTEPPTWKPLECPPPSTEQSNKKSKFSLKDLKAADCHAMECLSDVTLRNTRDRLGHNSPLCRGQALCNGDDEKYPDTIFQFGMAPTGALVWQKCHVFDPSETEIITLYDPNQQMESSQNLWFRMTPNATWQILRDLGEDSHVLWEHPVQNQPFPVLVTPQCLNERPILDCPYIHFRRHGDIIMNYIDEGGEWVACKSHKICYSDLWEN